MKVGFRRDKDIPALVVRASNAFGVVGTDVLFEGQPKTIRQLRVGILGKLSVRFAFAARQEEAQDIKAKLANKEVLNWATSNPRQLELVAQQRDMRLGEVLILGGGVEAALEDDPGLDAVFDIVDTARTLQAARLEIIQDNVAPILLTEIRKDSGSTPI